MSYKNDYSLSLNPLTMKLNGIVDPAVMGGIRNYEEASISLRRRIFDGHSSLSQFYLIRIVLCRRPFSLWITKSNIPTMSKTFPN